MHIKNEENEMGTREEILNIIEKNSRIDVHELSVLLGADELLVANELKALEEEGVICVARYEHSSTRSFRPTGPSCWVKWRSTASLSFC